jgi:hypothetical protein
VPEKRISKDKHRKVKINGPALPSSNDATSRLAANQFFDQNDSHKLLLKPLPSLPATSLLQAQKESL